jgi:hypothetical protein
VIILYIDFYAGDGIPINNIVQIARYLVRGFSATTRRAGKRRKNPSLNIFPAVSIFILITVLASISISAPVLIALAPASAPVSASALFLKKTGQRIVSALKILIDLYSGSFRNQNLLTGPFRESPKKGFLFKKSF